MKKILLTIPALLITIIAQAQTVLTIETKKGGTYTYTIDRDVDSIRIIEGVVVKVYPKNSKVSVDYPISKIAPPLLKTMPIRIPRKTLLRTKKDGDWSFHASTKEVM